MTHLTTPLGETPTHEPTRTRSPLYRWIAVLTISLALLGSIPVTSAAQPCHTRPMAPPASAGGSTPYLL
jgi:hypothetical protein